MTVFEEVKKWLLKNFQFKGRAMVWQFGSYNNGYCNFEPTFRFDTENSSFGYKFCDFDIKIYEESGLCHAKIDIYLSSYCDWETCFQGVIPSLDFLKQLFNCFILTEHDLK